MRRPRRPSPPRQSLMRFEGGLDTETPLWDVKPGALRQALNYEISVNGGYADIQGYERFDGRQKPSSADYSRVKVDITGPLAVDDIITQTATGAQGVIILINTDVTPSEIVITKNTGTFDMATPFKVSGVDRAMPLSLELRAGSHKDQAMYKYIASNSYRNDIDPVPGSGPIRGLWMISGISDTKYAFRDDLGGSECLIWKSTSNGWEQVLLAMELEFSSGGTYEMKIGDTIQSSTGTASAVIEKITVKSGSFAGGDAQGWLMVSRHTDPFIAGTLDVGANLDVATITGAAGSVTLAPGGSFNFVNANFGGQLGTKAAYGCDGVNRAFEFNGSYLAKVYTGMQDDSPSHIAVFNNHLFLAFGSSAQFSSIGNPHIWNPVFGAGEIATGDTITGFMVEPGGSSGVGSAVGAMGIYNRNTIHMLYGNDSTDFHLVKYRDEVGAYPGTIQQMSRTLFFDDRGIVDFATAQEFGNFQHSTVTEHIRYHHDQRKALAISSAIVREKNQYRVFFSDGSAYYVTMKGGSVVGVMPISLGTNVRKIFSLENLSGSEEIFFGSDGGFVYQMDAGTSLDGSNLSAYLLFHHWYVNSIMIEKSYITAAVQVRGRGYSEFELSYELSFDGSSIPPSEAEKMILNFSKQTWDFGQWDLSRWDGDSLQGAQVFDLDGSSESIAFAIRKESNQTEPHRLTGLMLHYKQRNILR